MIDDGLLDRINTGIYAPNHSFVPTVSSLAFKNPSFNWRENLERNLTCTGETPFDNYYIPRNNQNHVFFTEESIDWLFAELEGNPKPVKINYTQMRGKSTARKGQTLSYEVDPVQGNTSYNWYFDVHGVKSPYAGGWSIVSNNGNKVTVKAGRPGLAVVVCEVSNPCAGTITKYTYVDVVSRSGGGGNGEGGDDPCDNDNNVRLTYNSLKSSNATNTFLINRIEICDDGDGNEIDENFMPNVQKPAYTMSIHNIYGVKVFSKTQREKEFNVQNLKKGLYIVRYQIGLGAVHSKNILVD